MLKSILVALIRTYQKTVSPFLGPHCRFYPTCSEYTRQALQKHGAVKGMFLAVTRISKCHPFHSGGYDPVK